MSELPGAEDQAEETLHTLPLIWPGSDQASSEGWGLFDLSPRGIQVQRLAHAGVFEHDGQVWHFILERAITDGSPHHLDAIRAVRESNRDEFASLAREAASRGLCCDLAKHLDEADIAPRV